MSFSILKYRENYRDPGYKEFIIDTDPELNDVPVEQCAIGSEVYSVASGTRYILSNNKTWKTKKNTSGSGGGSSGIDGEDGGFYTPSVDANGVLTWVPSKNGMPSITSSNIKGDKGDRGIQGEKGLDGYTPVKGVDYFDGSNGANGENGGHYTPSINANGVLSWSASKNGMLPVPSVNIGDIMEDQINAQIEAYISALDGDNTDY